MAGFERSGRRKGRDSRSGSSRGESRGSGGTFEDFMKGKGRRGSGRDSGRSRRDSGRGGRRDSGRGSGRYGRDRAPLEMTKVICSECGVECEVPFKPTSSKPVYCSDCFEKREKGSSGNNSNKNLDIINEKLDKIMKALKID